MKTFLRINLSFCAVAAIFLTCAGNSARAQNFDPAAFSAMKWRLIGPFRGGRTIAVSGIPGDTTTFYFGSVGGGVWKTTDAGLVWKPIFDGQPVASIGALAIAPSDPNIIYVGTGEADLRSSISFGNGVYKSVDAGRTWTHIGLEDTHHIGRIWIDAHDPNIVLVAALGHAYGPNTERGVFRTTDGGKAWQKVLFNNADTGAIDLAAADDDPGVIYAALYQVRRPPWSSYPPTNGPGSGLYKSTDSGKQWTRISGKDLPPTEARIGVAVAPGTKGRRVYAAIDAGRASGLYRSDDGGGHWARVSDDPRITSRQWYFGGITVDPHNPDVVYVSNVSIYRSTDGGRNFVAFKGAPGGDDYHSLWIDPTNSARMILGCDQGASISVDGGQTWSSWFNQPTAEFYHVATDNGFPYYVYGAQQDIGTAAVASRGDYGAITERDWYSVGAGESGYILPDPQDPNVVYGGDTYGPLHRWDKRTDQSQNISPWPSDFGGSIAQESYRFTWTSPLAFSPETPGALYMGSQFLLKTVDEGMSWQKISPDLTGADLSAQPATAGSAPTTVENAKGRGYGVIYSIAPSALQAGQIWAGTDTGLVQLTRDEGATWHNVTPPGLGDWSKISIIDASHFDPATAYIAVDRHRLDDYQPIIYRTHDYGATWTKITQGIPAGAFVNAVREDTERKGLLFAATEYGVYASFDDGNAWQPLQMNLPVTSVRDLVVHGDDLVIATHGRSFWILDDITPLRQWAGNVMAADAYFFQPQTAIRFRNKRYDTPFPLEIPLGQNPPEGAIFDYYLRAATEGEIKLDILDAAGHTVRSFSSNDAPPPRNNRLSYPDYWVPAPVALTKSAGLNRFVWDLRYAAAVAVPAEFEAAPGGGPLSLPGEYTVRLTVAGGTYMHSLKVVMDPRVRTLPADWAEQFALGMKISRVLESNAAALKVGASLQRQIAATRRALGSGPRAFEISPVVSAVKREMDAIFGSPGQFPPSGLARMSGSLAGLAEVVDSADARPTAQAQAKFDEISSQIEALLARWEKLKSGDLAALNKLLAAQHRPEITIEK